MSDEMPPGPPDRTASRDADALTLAFVGDVGLCLRVPRLLRRATDGTEAHAFAERLRAADLTFANLEAALHPEPDSYPEIKVVGRTDDAALLSAAGIDVVTLANNHVLDLGPDGLEHTRAALDRNGVRYFGAGRNLEEALEPLVLECKGRKIGFLGFVEGRPRTHKYAARRNAPGAAYLDSRHIRDSVARLRPQVDLLVVSFHQGVNYVHYASPRQRGFVRDAVGAGADLVIGHHPHVIQGWERMGQALVFYSLGEFLWDPEVGDVVEPRWDATRRRTGILEVTAPVDGPLRFQFIPFERTPDFELRELEGEERSRFLRWFEEISSVYEDYDPSVYLEAAGHGVVNHTMKVLAYNLRRGNVRYLARSLARVRGRHLAIAWTHLRGRLGKRSR